jgi:hypothetical protein
MPLMHHNELRVNSDQFTEDTFGIWHDQGWTLGPHPDTDPDDDSVVPRVLPAPEPKASDPDVAPTPKKKD